eukprot:TRINITY_DN49629_c0_g3_i5.p1 TRINITY_DN49629_c0_g3~~TRINITY_DN49629_c0_g3_i5.p1  ORF type:complete len:308 (-),score=39.81 TRINITY_DN49629_c0_g3_i5:166-1089(-)
MSGRGSEASSWETYCPMRAAAGFISTLPKRGSAVALADSLRGGARETWSPGATAPQVPGLLRQAATPPAFVPSVLSVSSPRRAGDGLAASAARHSDAMQSGRGAMPAELGSTWNHRAVSTGYGAPSQHHGLRHQAPIKQLPQHSPQHVRPHASTASAPLLPPQLSASPRPDDFAFADLNLSAVASVRPLRQSPSSPLSSGPGPSLHSAIQSSFRESSPKGIRLRDAHLSTSLETVAAIRLPDLGCSMGGLASGFEAKEEASADNAAQRDLDLAYSTLAEELRQLNEHLRWAKAALAENRESLLLSSR